MGNITFLIGNGFDLNAGLKTSYINFYETYAKLPSNSKTIEKFKKEILRSEAYGWKDWADFEIGMGEKSTLFEGEEAPEEFLECFNDFSVNFHNYLQNECLKVDWDLVDVESEIIKKFLHSINNFHDDLKTSKKNEILATIANKQRRINFLQLNYTDVLDKLYANTNLSKFGKNLHIHGNIGGGYHTIGVDTIEQIKNENIRNSEKVQTIFVKPQFSDLLKKNNIHHGNERDEALSIIKSSTIICAFGTSLGETDGFWWEKIGRW